jgi:hypothetical protein
MRTKRMKVNKLKQLKITRVDTVDRGAQQHAHIVIAKRYTEPAPVAVAKREPVPAAPVRAASVIEERIAKAAPDSAMQRFYQRVSNLMMADGVPIEHATLAIAREDPQLYGEVQAEAPIVPSKRASMT